MEANAARLGLSVPNEWWASSALLKEIEAAGFSWAQVHAPPAPVLASARHCTAHAAGLRRSLGTTGLRCVVHAPSNLLAGAPGADRALEGLLAYAAESGAESVVYHARALPDDPTNEDRVLAETRSLARLASLAERLEVQIALENLAPVYPGPESLSAIPLALRELVHRLGSERVGVCVDVGHAHVVADRRHTSLSRLIEPVLDVACLFHLHDNLGARWTDQADPSIDPLRLDLHLPPGRGSIAWADVAPRLREHDAPLLFEVHPPRPPAAELARAAADALGLPIPNRTAAPIT